MSNMNQTFLERDVYQILTKQGLGYSFDELTAMDAAKTHLANDLGADSLDAVEITMCLEDHFNIEISDDEMNKTLTIQEIIDLVRKKTNDKGAPQQ